MGHRSGGSLVGAFDPSIEAPEREQAHQIDLPLDVAFFSVAESWVRTVLIATVRWAAIASTDLPSPSGWLAG